MTADSAYVPVPTPAVVTLLFTDIVGSTELLTRVGDEAFDAVRRSHFRLLHDAVVGAGGAEVKNLGDGLMAVFASAADALSCAVTIQQGVTRRNRRAGDTSFDVRVGLHAGEPLRDEEDYFGMPVVVAKRLCDTATAGQILASRLVVDLASSGPALDAIDVGPLALKGLDAPVHACAVPWSDHVSRSMPPALSALRGATFVGRDTEAARLAEVLHRVENGRREVVLIAGEPGIGKTTLAARAAEEAAESGALVLFGMCDEQSVVPYQPFVEALGQHVETTPADELQRQLGAQAGDLALLVPGLERRLPDVAATERGGDTERYRVFEAVNDLLRRLAEDGPVVLVLDDLHWADRPTLQLLGHVVRRCADVPLLVLGTYRDTDLDRSHPMAEALVDLRRAEAVTRLSLRGLALDDVVDLVDPTRLRDPHATALAEALWRETEGSPLFLREILRHLSETGAVIRDADGRWVACRRIDQLGIPEGVREVIGRRLSRLSEPANALLVIAAVVGREFAVEVLERLTDLSPDGVLDGLDEAAAAGIVAEVVHQPGSYTFTHALVRQALYDELSLTRRVRWHERVGAALEARYANDLATHASELAHHFSLAAAAGHADKAIAYCRQAAERELGRVAYEEAARHFGMALEVAEDCDAPLATRAELLLRQGQAHWRAGDEVARATFVRAASLARSIGDPRVLAHAALGFVGTSARPVWVEMAAVNDEAIDLLEEALAGVGDGDAALRAELLSTLARELYWTPGSRARREALAAEAVAMARDAADDRLLGWVLVNTTLATMGPDNPAARVAASEEAIALAERLGDRQLLVTAVFYLAVAALELGDTKRFESMWQRGAALAAELKDPVLTETVRYAEATIADADGRLAEGDATRIEAFLLGQESRDRNVVIQFLVGTVTSLRRQGRAAEGLGQAATSIALYPLAAATIHALVAAACVEMGDFERAGQELAAVDLADPSLACGDVTWLTTVGALGLAAAGLGDLDRAARLYDALTPYAGQFACVGHLSVLGAVDEYLGVLATALGRHDEAVAHLRAGLTAHERTGWRALIVEAQARLAGALLARGHPSDREEGVQLARAAVANADDFGMRAVARYARQVLGTAAGEDHAEGAPVSLAERGRSRLTHGARSLVGRFSRDHGDDDLVRRFGGQLAQRALFSAMAKSFQPSTAFGFEGAIQFDVAVPADGDPLPPDWWTIEVRGRKATCHRGRHADPSATIHTSLPALVRLLSGELHPMRAVIEGKVRVDGDVLVAARIQDMFGGLEVSSL